MQSIVTNFLQPAGNFIRRPPLEPKVVRPLCCATIALGIVAVGLVAAFSFREAHADKPVLLKSCETPETHRACTETTSYPKYLNVHLHPWASIEVVLHGPERLSTSRMEEIMRGMTCQLLSSSADGSFSYSHRSRIANPTDFRITCINSRMPQLSVRPVNDGLHYGAVFDHFRLLRKLRLQRSNFEYLDLTVLKEYFEQGQAGFAGLSLQFGNGSAYGVGELVYCEGEPPSRSAFYRDCTSGSPYLPGAVMSHVFPDLCPDPSGVNFDEIYSRLAKDPSWRTFRSDLNENASIMHHLAQEICIGAAESIESFLDRLEGYDPLKSVESMRRPTSKIIHFITEQVQRQCPFSFQCAEQEFQGEFIWLAVAYPFLVLIAKIGVAIIPRAYASLLRLGGFPSRSPATIEQNMETAQIRDLNNVEARCVPSDGAQTRMPNNCVVGRTLNTDARSSQEQEPFSQAANQTNTKSAALFHGHFDVDALRDLPHDVSRIEQRLLRLEGTFGRFEMQAAEAAERALSSVSRIQRTSAQTVDATSQPQAGKAMQPLKNAMQEHGELADKNAPTNNPWLVLKDILRNEMMETLEQELQIWREELHAVARLCKQLGSTLELRCPHFIQEALSQPDHSVSYGANHREALTGTKDTGLAGNIGIPDVVPDSSGSSVPPRLQKYVEDKLLDARAEIRELAYLVDHLRGFDGDSEHVIPL